jgi:hypothetical protein
MMRAAAQPEYLALSLVIGRLISVGIFEDWMTIAPGERLPSTYERSDAERKLEWLRRFVAPTVKWLEERGHGDDAATALEGRKELSLVEARDSVRLRQNSRLFHVKQEEGESHAGIRCQNLQVVGRAQR